MKAAYLEARGTIKIFGPDAQEWLQGLITNDITKANGDDACFAALLSPQGKILFDFLIYRLPGADGDQFIIDCAADQSATLAKRLSMYRLRSKVEVADVSEDCGVLAIWDCAGRPAADARRDPRHPVLGWRLAGARAAVQNAVPPTVDSSAYAAFRISLGVPEGGVDFAWGDIFPHDANMDELDGVDFKKGCYVGQEVVSRVQHRGSARKRIRKLSFSGPAGTAGTSLKAGETELGSITSVAGSLALALVRTDRVGEAQTSGTQILVGEAPAQISLDPA